MQVVFFDLDIELDFVVASAFGLWEMVLLPRVPRCTAAATAWTSPAGEDSRERFAEECEEAGRWPIAKASRRPSAFSCDSLV